MSVGDAALAPSVKALMAQLELGAQNGRPDLVDKLAMGMPISEHAPLYQRCVDTTSPLSFIARTSLLPDGCRMSFGCRLKAAIKGAGYKNPRRFAIDGLGWDEQGGPQRLQNYINGRVPDRETLKLIAAKLGTSPGELLNESVDAGLRDILLTLLELEGIPVEKADTLASAVLAAKRLLEAAPNDGPLATRAKIAAHAVWQTQRPQSPDM